MKKWGYVEDPEDTCCFQKTKRLARDAVTKRKADPQSQCEGKYKYESFEDAQCVVSHVKRRFPLSIYKCKYCTGWHIGNNLRYR